MPLYSTADIARFALNGEEIFNAKFNCIVDRVALDIVSGTSLYILSESVLNIRRITWKGFKLAPMSQRDLRESLLSGTQQGRPENYVFNNVGQNTIQFFPVPNETLPVTTSNLWSTSISTKCIVEYHAIPNGETLAIPDFIKRRLVKAYTVMRCFQQDNKGNNVKGVKYWKQKWESLMGMYGEALEDLISKPRKLVDNDTEISIGLAGPILDTAEFGIGVDE